MPTSPVQYTSARVRQEAQDNSPVLGTLYDLGTIVSNVAPSVLVNALTGGLGAPAAVAKGLGAAAM
ncbi:MAG: hypothetical protein LBL15_00855, partial [Oscillospiraceae bacterium]|nr:hypothetical protein [Oscillospiraceae bacterium]